MNPTIEIFISGQTDPNPGPGVWAVALYSDDHERLLSGEIEHCTNHEAELIAAIEAFRAIKADWTCEVSIYSNSQYLVNVMRRAWKTDNNGELFAELREVSERHTVLWCWSRANMERRLNDIRAYAIKRLYAVEEQEL